MEKTIMIVKKLEGGGFSAETAGTGEDELYAIRAAVIAVLNNLVKRGLTKITAAAFISGTVQLTIRTWMLKN